jgi:hypothetical protein
MARLEAFVTTAEEFDQLPVLRGTMNRMLGEFRNRWPETLPLPLYPAFRKGEHPESELS